MSVILRSCTPIDRRFIRVGIVLCIINHTIMSAWGIFVWVRAKHRKSDDVVVLFGQDISIDHQAIKTLR